jgi:hypothetical protein
MSLDHISAQRLEFYVLALPWQLSYSLNDVLMHKLFKSVWMISGRVSGLSLGHLATEKRIKRQMAMNTRTAEFAASGSCIRRGKESVTAASAGGCA